MKLDRRRFLLGLPVLGAAAVGRPKKRHRSKPRSSGSSMEGATSEPVKFEVNSHERLRILANGRWVAQREKGGPWTDFFTGEPVT